MTQEKLIQRRENGRTHHSERKQTKLLFMNRSCEA
jgi:hypothetical protein